MNNTESNNIPGWKQPWLWFLLAPLFAVFIMGFTMLWLSISSNDGVIVDNYYKDGLSIHTRATQDENARNLELSASLRFDQRVINLVISGKTSLATIPDRLWLHLIHPTQQTGDILVELNRSGTGFTGALEEIPKGRFQIMLSPDMDQKSEDMWRLHGNSHLPADLALELIPR